eukprot:m.10061 g.10061  ORF g.10061 m.10061 type:complete len:224 (-) comp5521_c0_seq1:65-736(-)
MGTSMGQWLLSPAQLAWLVAFVATALPYTFSQGKEFGDYEVAVKCTPIFLLMGWVFSLRDKLTGKSAILLLAALWFSMCGDAALVSPDRFVLGVVFFRTAHFFFIALYSQGFKYNPYPSIMCFALCVGSMINLQDVLVNNVELRFTLITYMIAFAVDVLCAICGTKHNWQVASFGVVLFALSDTLLSTNKFLMPIPNSHALIHITYYLGQLLMTVGVLLPQET